MDRWDITTEALEQLEKKRNSFWPSFLFFFWCSMYIYVCLLSRVSLRYATPEDYHVRGEEEKRKGKRRCTHTLLIKMLPENWWYNAFSFINLSIYMKENVLQNSASFLSIRSHHHFGSPVHLSRSSNERKAFFYFFCWKFNAYNFKRYWVYHISGYTIFACFSFFFVWKQNKVVMLLPCHCYYYSSRWSWSWCLFTADVHWIHLSMMWD